MVATAEVLFRRQELWRAVTGSSISRYPLYWQNILYVSLCVSVLCCPPQQRRALHARHAPQAEPDKHRRPGAAGGPDAFT